MKTRDTKMTADVTVLMSTYNRAAFLDDSISSLLGQTISARKLIVVDDGSTDETPSVLGKYGDQVTVIRKDNEGKPRAINCALRHVSTEYVWIFDDDDVALPDALERQWAVVTNCESRPAFTYGSFLNGAGEPGMPMRLLGDAGVPQVSDSEFTLRLLVANFLANQAMLIRTDILVSLGGFNEKLIRAQDYDLNLRVARNHRGAFVPEPLFIRRVHSGERGRSGERFSAHLQEKKWYEYQKVIFAELLRDLKFDEVFPEKASHPYLSHATQEQLLYLVRFAIAGRKGLWTNAEADLCALQSCLPSAPTLARNDVVRWMWVALSEPYSVIELLRISALHQPIVRAFSRGPVSFSYLFFRAGTSVTMKMVRRSIADVGLLGRLAYLIGSVIVGTVKYRVARCFTGRIKLQ